jgi:predicted nucleic acid-binding protein
LSKGYLLDTSVLSLLAPGRPLEGPLSGWLSRNGHRLYMSTITIAEIEQGICKLRRHGADARAERLSGWLDALIESGAERILPLSIEAARLAGQLSDKAIAAGRYPGFADVAIAAIAGVHNILVLTLNGRHFAPLDINYLDPLAGPLP